MHAISQLSGSLLPQSSGGTCSTLALHLNISYLDDALFAGLAVFAFFCFLPLSVVTGVAEIVFRTHFASDNLIVGQYDRGKCVLLK